MGPLVGTSIEIRLSINRDPICWMYNLGLIHGVLKSPLDLLILRNKENTTPGPGLINLASPAEKCFVEQANLIATVEFEPHVPVPVHLARKND